MSDQEDDEFLFRAAVTTIATTIVAKVWQDTQAVIASALGSTVTLPLPMKKPAAKKPPVTKPPTPSPPDSVDVPPKSSREIIRGDPDFIVLSPL